MDDDLMLKNRLEMVRQKKNIAQEELARMVGVSQQTIDFIEKGRYHPTIRLALLLCIALEQKFEDLFYLE